MPAAFYKRMETTMKNIKNAINSSDFGPGSRNEQPNENSRSVTIRPWVSLRSRPRLVTSSWTGVKFSSLNR
jgi:hypothetical protein